MARKPAQMKNGETKMEPKGGRGGGRGLPKKVKNRTYFFKGPKYKKKLGWVKSGKSDD